MTAVPFTHLARARCAAHDITTIERIVTENGACHRAEAFGRTLLGSRHRRITPYSPRDNGKVEGYIRIISTEFLYARVWTSQDQGREALGSGTSTTATTHNTPLRTANLQLRDSR